MRKLFTSVVLFLLFFYTALSFASGSGSVMGNGGASEITQLANNAQLAKTVAQNAQQIAVEITTATNTVNTYMTALQNLQHLPAAAIAKLLAPYKNEIKAYGQLYQAVNGIYTTSITLKNTVEQRYREMVTLNKSPKEYLASEMAYAQSQGAGAGKRLENDMRTLQNFETKAKELDEVQKNIPGSVTGNIQGLEMLNQQVAAMRSENMEMRAVMLQQKMLAERQLQESSDQKTRSADMAIKAAQEADARAKRNEQDIGPTKFVYPSLF